VNSPTFPVIRLPMFQSVEVPPVVRVKLSHPTADAVPDLEGAVVAALEGRKRLQALEPGARVAIAVGSRGIAHIAEVVRAAVTWLKARGFEPFIVPAMGSHAGGTAEGQAGMLAALGVSKETVGAPVHATMEVVEVGKTDEGIPCCFDKNAAGADGVVVINRVKSHTSFDRTIESGLVKMVAVGLGKAQGANCVHQAGPRGMTEVLPDIARVSLAKAPIACGVALVENAHKQLAAIEGVEPEDFFETEMRLLKFAKSLLARLPFSRIDGLVVEWLGKDISGSGMDFAITGRCDNTEEKLALELMKVDTSEYPRPFVVKLGLLGVTPASHGNAMGIGLANYTTRHVAENADLYSMYFNAAASTMTQEVHFPMVLPDERDVVNACVASGWRLEAADTRLCIIHSTLHLDEVLVSPALLADMEEHEGIEVISEPEPIRFSDDGRLLTRCNVKTDAR
jgi:hypothetical protein